MRISALTGKVMGSALLAGLTFVAVQAMPVQAAVPDRGARPDQQVAAYRDYLSGSQDHGAYVGGRRDDQRGTACTTSWFGARGDRGGQDCAGDRGVDRGRFTPSFTDRGQRVDRGDHRDTFHGGDR